MSEEQMNRDKGAILHLYDKVLPNLANRIHENLGEIIPLFHDFKLERVLDTWTKGPDTSDDTPISIENGNVQHLGLRVLLEGFQKAGAIPFDIKKDLVFRLHLNYYEVGPDKTLTWVLKDYYQTWSSTETNETAQRWCDDLIAELTEQLEKML